MTIGAIILVPLPVVVQLYSGYILLSWMVNGHLIAAALSGQVCYFPHGAFQLPNGERIQIQNIVTLYAVLFLVIECRNRRFLLWRDSCNEQQYRMLLFDQKRRHNASVELDNS